MHKVILYLVNAFHQVFMCYFNCNSLCLYIVPQFASLVCSSEHPSEGGSTILTGAGRNLRIMEVKCLVKAIQLVRWKICRFGLQVEFFFHQTTFPECRITTFLDLFGSQCG